MTNLQEEFIELVVEQHEPYVKVELSLDEHTIVNRMLFKLYNDFCIDENENGLVIDEKLNKYLDILDSAYHKMNNAEIVN